MAAIAAATTTAVNPNTVPVKYRPVGVALAVGSGLLIGSSFVFKKKGLLSSQKGHAAGEGVGYLKSPLWWTGMTIMILGEICNLVAYSFLEAIVVTPLGALSVVISAMLSHIFLKEKLSLFGWISCIQCLLGATILALNGPEEQSVTTIAAFKKLFLAPGFLSYGSVIIAIAVFLAVYAIPRWGQKSMFPSIGICSLIGGLSVSCTQGLGACVITSIRGENQFKNWFIYFLLAFVVVTLLTEIYFLNVALALFNTAMVTPTYYVMFTFCTLVTSVILYQGLKASASQIITVVLGFFVICTGIFILQMSKIDPRDLVPAVDDRTSLLLQAARAEVDPKAARKLERDLSKNSRLTRRTGRSMSTRSRTTSSADPGVVEGLPLTSSRTNLTAHPPPQHIEEPVEEEKEEEEEEEDSDSDMHSIVEKSEDPGIDSVRSTLGIGVIGSIIRARKRNNTLKRLRNQQDLEKGTGSRNGIPRNGSGNGTNGIGLESPPLPASGLQTGTSTTRLSNSVSLPNFSQTHRPSSVRFADSEAGTPHLVGSQSPGSAEGFELAQVQQQQAGLGSRPVPARSQTLPMSMTLGSGLSKGTTTSEEELDEKKGDL
ncbi:hypothetical protein M422DRAFT_780571 [Sphaerobolus stellatus SS14]|uniref:Magnesium transporter n=1 Tax=Sphaerobolus stellatus (strain SS14) TaxID=990650 RepID=A0A0C9VHQ4_SPHS4|nr:hypothetical protein M422DRAFT_780571 [Sphaerobolus stellatus SS14]